MVREPKDLFDPQAFLARVGTGKTISVYRKDQVIFSQGEVADTIFYIQKGSVKIVVLSDQGKEAVVGILEAGQFFGEGCMNGHSLRIATSTATEESPQGSFFCWRNSARKAAEPLSARISVRKPWPR
jgi:CRP/FNR family transcriptional regulator, cyclic AMP receptor protein